MEEEIKKTKAFILVDVTNLTGKQYWELADWLKEKKIEFTDADFK